MIPIEDKPQIDTEDVLLEAMSHCAKAYDRDITRWADDKSLWGLSHDISTELHKMGYRLEQFRFNIDESKITTEDGE